MNCLIAAFLLYLAFAGMPSIVTASESKDKKISKCPLENIEDARNNYNIEQAKIARTAGRVVRKGLRLELHTDKRVIVLEDDCSDGESYGRHYFEGHLTDLGYFLVNVVAFEGEGFILINDKTGKQEQLTGEPLFSPDKKRLVTTSTDFMAGYSNRTIEVWRLTSMGLKEEYLYDTLNEKNCGASDAKWLDNKKIQLTLECSVNDTSSLTTKTKARLIMNKGKWHLLK